MTLPSTGDKHTGQKATITPNCSQQNGISGIGCVQQPLCSAYGHPTGKLGQVCVTMSYKNELQRTIPVNNTGGIESIFM